MCEPVTISMMIVGAASMAALKAQEQEAKNKAMTEQQRAQVNAQQLAQNETRNEMQEINRLKGLELTDLRRKAFRDSGAAKAATSESGASGATRMRLLGNNLMQESFTKGRIMTSNEIMQAKVGKRSEKLFYNTSNNIRKLEDKKVTGMQAGMQLAISAVQGAAMGATGGAGVAASGAATAAAASTMAVGTAGSAASAAALLAAQTASYATMATTLSTTLTAAGSGYYDYE